MSKATVFLFLISILFFACQSETKTLIQTETALTPSNNALLAETVMASYISTFQSADHHPWKNNFDHKRIFGALIENIQNKNIDVYNADFPIEFQSEALTKKEITELYGQKDELITNLVELYTYEAWNFDLKQLTFQKEIFAWAPIHSEYQEDPPRTKRKKFFYIRQPSSAAASEDRGELIAENMVTHLSFLDEEPRIIGLDQVLFRKKIFDAIQNNQFKLFDATFLVDQTEKEITTKEVEEKFQITIQEALLNQELTNLVFLEDWYLNTSSYQLTKQVKAIGFVGENFYDTWDIDGNILFTIVLN